MSGVLGGWLGFLALSLTVTAPPVVSYCLLRKLRP